MAKQLDSQILGLFAQSKGILAGISGGRDSMALLHLLQPFYSKLSVAHINYQTRSNSQLEEELVRQSCAALSLPCHVLKAEGCSLDMPNFEAHARKVRYAFYQEIAEQCGADILALGQHQSDLAETVLLRLLRGSPRLYVQKIRPLNKNLCLVRPLLSWSRSEITAHCEAHGLSWREDESNQSTYFLRNYLRHSILPLLSAKVPQTEARLALAARLCEESENFLQSEAQKQAALLGAGPEAKQFKALHPALKRRILALWFEEHSLPAPGVKACNEIFRKLSDAKGGIILHRQNKKEFALKGGRLIWRQETA